MACQDYFIHFEPSQSVGWAKTRDPREKPPDHLQAEFGLSHVTRARLEPSGEMTSNVGVLKNSGLNHLATEATNFKFNCQDLSRAFGIF